MSRAVFHSLFAALAVLSFASGCAREAGSACQELRQQLERVACHRPDRGNRVQSDDGNAAKDGLKHTYMNERERESS